MAYSYVKYTANGSTVNYTFSFPYIDKAHIVVRVNGVGVTAFTFLNNSTIAFNTAPAAGASIEIRRFTPKDVPIVDFQDGSILLEKDLDLAVTFNLYIAQEADDIVKESIFTQADGTMTASGRRISNVADPVNAQDAVTKAWAETGMSSQLAQATTQGTLATTKATEAANSATSAAGSAATATTKATESATSASASAGSATASANSATSSAASATTATTKAAEASASATAASTSAGNASSSAAAAAGSASNAASSATSAAGSATTATTKAAEALSSANTATTKATEASTSASNAATSASNAASSASGASTSATTASTKASEAAASAASAAADAATITTNITTATSAATSATASATSASNSATSAAASAASAATALDAFDDRYLGSKTADPTVDNDGNALLTGALYYRSTAPAGMKVYDGVTWVAASSAAQAFLVPTKITATAGQTSFSASYTVGNILVTLNGVILDATDYTATNGTSVVLASGATVGDELVVYAFSNFSVANTYTKSEADGLLAAKQATLVSGSNIKTINSVSLLGSGDIVVGGSDPGIRNRIINGDMRIDQRNAGASVTNSASVSVAMYGLVDRWAYWADVASKFSAQRSTTAPEGFTHSLLITSLSAYSVGSGSWTTLTQFVEGFNCSDLGWGTAVAKAVTVSFWVRSSLTGTFGASISNGSDNRSYPFTYAISAANTWEKKTVTIPGDTSGSWFTDNQRGLALNLNLATGSTYTATAGAWGAGWKVNATGATNFLATNGATLYITGVQLEKGSTATAFEYRDYGREFQLCQRYYNTFFVGFDFYAASGYQGNAFSFAVEMRAKPTLTAIGTADQSNVNLTYFPAASNLLNASGFCAQVGMQTANVRTYYFNTLSSSAEL